MKSWSQPPGVLPQRQLKFRVSYESFQKETVCIYTCVFSIILKHGSIHVVLHIVFSSQYSLSRTVSTCKTASFDFNYCVGQSRYGFRK